MSNRPFFVGAFVTRSVRDRIRQEAILRETSVSQLVFSILLEVLHLPDDSNPSLEDLCALPKEDQIPFKFED